MNRRFWLLFATALVAVFGLIGIVNAASASLPGSSLLTAFQGSLGTNIQAPDKPVYDDGFDALPLGLKGMSYSTLAMSGKVHPAKPGPFQATSWKNPYAPLLNITWGPERDTSGTNQGEPAAGMHPTNPLYAMVSGNFSLDNTTDGGVTWLSRQLPNPHNSGDVVNAFLQGGGGGEALSLAINGTPYNFTCARSTDFGVTWVTDVACGTGVSTSQYFDDREYIFVDRSPASPFNGRVYVTSALFDAGGSGSFNTMTNRWSSDNGATWNPPDAQILALVPNNEFALGLNHNEYPSIGISPNGTVGYAWHRGMCCGGPSPINSPNKVMFTRSTDGGVSFPFSTTVVTVPLNQTVPFNSTGPGGTRWSDTPNIVADPTTNGIFYAIWVQYRTPSTPASSAVYLSKTTDNGATWSAPIIPYNNPNANIFQEFGWVKVTPDHTVHVTYTGGTTSNSVMAHFYVQSTDGGTTWTAPFQLSATTFGPFAVTTDYEAIDVGGYSGGPLGPGTILATWAENHHFARLGTFVQGTPTPTPTGTPPTATRTNTPTLTPSATGTTDPCLLQNYQFATGTATIVAGTTDVGSHCDDCNVPVPLPFPYQLYDQTYNSVNVDSNGNMGFVTADDTFTNTCLPDALANYAIFPHWDDLCTGPCGTSTCASCGVFSVVTGTAPNRIFTLEWRANYYNTNTPINFEVRLYEGQRKFDIIYGVLNGTGSSATIGVQRATGTGGQFTQFECNTGGLSNGMMLTGTLPTCGGGSPTITPTIGGNTSTPTRTPTITLTPLCTPQAGGWSAGPALPNPPNVLVRGVGVYFPANGKFYSVGGRTADTAGSDYQHVLEYTPGNPGTWVQKGVTLADNFMNNMACGVLTVSGTPQIYCVGGSFATGTTATARVFAYNPVTDVATTLTGDDWPGNAAGTILPGGFAVSGNKLYILGGFNINVASTNQIWQFDPTLGVGAKWLQRVNTPMGIMYAPTAAMGSLIYVLGASDYSGGTVIDTTNSFSFDPAANTIGSIAAIPRATGETRAVVVGTTLWVLGGGRVAPNPSTQVDIYTPGSNTWSVGSPFTTARRNFPADSNGSTVWLAGGYDSTGVTPLGSMEIFRPGQACGTNTPTSPPGNTSTPTRTNTVTYTPTPTSPGNTSTVTRTSTPTNTPTNTPTGTVPTNTPTFTDTPVTTPGSETDTPTPTPIISPTSCPIQFTDVPSGSTFYVWIRCLACRGIVNGYPDGTFRPNNNVTRGQLSKIVSNSAGFIDPQTVQMFQDVPPGSTFFDYIGRLASRGFINGYPCGGPGEPCVPPDNLPYFRPNNNATRGQISKIVSNAAGFIEPVSGQTFEDVAPGSTFYDFIERLATRGVMQGYPCGGAGEPCVPPGNRPYFRPNNNATRGQTSKIVANTFFPACETPSRPNAVVASR